MSYTSFPNKAGDHEDTDDILRSELKAAGIQTLQEAEGKPQEYLADLLREQSGEVKTSVLGALHGWTFKRAWYYWTAKGPGLDVDTAEALHATHGLVVRVDGHAGAPNPREWFKGLACSCYHVDSAEGLKALADAIKGVVAKSAAVVAERKAGAKQGILSAAALEALQVENARMAAQRALDAAERAWHAYASLCEVGLERTMAFDVLENVRLARRVC